MEYSTRRQRYSSSETQAVGDRPAPRRSRRAFAPRRSTRANSKRALPGYLSAALANLLAVLTVRLAVLVALDTVFAAVPVALDTVLAALPLADDNLRAAVRVADLTAPLTIFSIEERGGGRLMPCALSNALTASDNSFTRSVSRSTSDDV